MNSRYRSRPSLGFANLVGLRTLYVREVKRIFKIYGQTILAPIVTTLLFLLVFDIVFGSNRMIGNVPYREFLVPGLLMMATLQSSFANTSTSLIQQKLNDSIVDVLMPPLNSVEMTAGYILGGVTRGLLVAFSTGLTLLMFHPLSIHNFLFIALHGLSAALMMSVVGLMTGIWAEKFDHISTVTNFIILPLSFMSGTFFSIERFPDFLKTISYFNPFFYMIDGFRYGFTGSSEGPLLTGLIVVTSSNLILLMSCLKMIETGYKLRS